MRMVVLGLAGLMLAACGGGSGDPAPATAAQDTPASAATPAGQASSVAELKGSIGALATAAVDVAGDAAKVAGDLIDTSTACQLTGQSPEVCGCVAEALGPRLSGETIEAVTGVLAQAAGGQIQGAIEGATGIDPATREALTRCAVQGAVSGAVAQ